MKRLKYFCSNIAFTRFEAKCVVLSYCIAELFSVAQRSMIQHTRHYMINIRGLNDVPFMSQNSKNSLHTGSE